MGHIDLFVNYSYYVKPVQKKKNQPKNNIKISNDSKNLDKNVNQRDSLTYR